MWHPNKVARKGMGLGRWPRAGLLCPVWVKVRPSGSCQSQTSHSCDRCGNHFRQKSRGVHPQEVKTQKPGRRRGGEEGELGLPQQRWPRPRGHRIHPLFAQSSSNRPGQPPGSCLPAPTPGGSPHPSHPAGLWPISSHELAALQTWSPRLAMSWGKTPGRETAS